jgi:hypothetical protein
MAGDEDIRISAWVHANDFGPSAAHLHALGAIALSYNELEIWLENLFKSMLPLVPEVSSAVFARLTNSQRQEVFRAVIEAYLDPAEREVFNQALTCYGICTENRNTLAHLADAKPTTPTSEFLLGWKMNSSKSKQLLFLISIEELRRVAEEILATATLTRALGFYLFRQWHERKYGPDGEIGGLKMSEIGPNLLPVLPPKPRKLDAATSI